MKEGTISYNQDRFNDQNHFWALRITVPAKSNCMPLNHPNLLTLTVSQEEEVVQTTIGEHNHISSAILPRNLMK